MTIPLRPDGKYVMAEREAEMELFTSERKLEKGSRTMWNACKRERETQRETEREEAEREREREREGEWGQEDEQVKREVEW
jgi:hypothetical protein